MSLPEPAEVQQAIDSRKKLADAYLTVFGHPEKRSEFQRIVWEDIEKFCHAYNLVSEARTDGELAADRALFNDGRRSVWLRMRGQIITAGNPKPKPPTVTRKRAAKPV